MWTTLVAEEGRIKNLNVVIYYHFSEELMHVRFLAFR